MRATKSTHKSTKNQTAQTACTISNAERLKLFKLRLDKLKWAQCTDLPKPVEVQQAEEAVRAWSIANGEHRRKQSDEHQRNFEAISDAMLLGDMEKALTLLQKLEASRRK